MGRLKVLQPDPEVSDPEHPGESTADGCPGAWYRCDFATSLLPYERLLSDSGYSENLLLTQRSKDRLLLEACGYLERERLRAKNYDDKRAMKHVSRQ